MDTRLSRSWWVLRIGLGVVPIVAGIDKFFNILTNWEMYLNPLAPRLLHVTPATFMHMVGIVEIIVGIGVLSRFTRYFAYVVMVWMWCIALSLLVQWAFVDVAVRDIAISLGAYTLAALSEVRSEQGSPARAARLSPAVGEHAPRFS